MDNQEHWQSKIDKYMRNQMDEQERSAFEEALKDNPQLAKELAIQQDLVTGVRTLGNRGMKEQLQQMHEEVMEIKAKNKVHKTRRLFWRGAAAAAVLLIGILAYQTWLNPTNSPEQLYASYYQAYDLNLQDRGDQPPAGLLEATALYEQKAYAEALPLLESLVANDSGNTQLHLSIGICKMELDRHDEAIDDIQKVLTLGDPLLEDQANWYLALIHVKQNQPTLARTFLQKLAEDSAADHHAEARQLLEQLK